MNDLIYRDQTIEAISKLPVKVDNFGYTWMIASDVLKQIDSIPSAEPERKKGSWIYDTERVLYNGGIYAQYHCSECGFRELLGRLENFCPNCGAEMTGRA